jgi:competence ComEA-like helix-hairpin-helix protein
LGLSIALVAYQRSSTSLVTLKRPVPLPQDAKIQVYTNHNPASEFTDAYRHQTRSGDDLEQILIDAIQSARTSVDVAVQELRLPRLAQALRDRQQAGVPVRVILENTYTRPHSAYTASELQSLPSRERSRIAAGRHGIDANQDGDLSPEEIHQQDALVILQRSGIPMIDDRGDGSQGSGLMHHKFVVIDNRLVIVTSANFTLSDMVGDFSSPESRGNANTLLRIDSPELATHFTQEFALLWGDGPGGLPNSRFGSRKPYRPPQSVLVDKTRIDLQFSPQAAAIPWDTTSNGLIAKTLETAQNSIDLALFVFSDQLLANRLEPLHHRGVQIRALIEPDFIFRPYSEALDMLGISLGQNCHNELTNQPWQRPLTTVGVPHLPPGDLLHHKFAVVDRQTVVVGSHNWSTAANRSNDEVVLVIHSPIVAAHFQQEFDHLAADAQFGIPAQIQQQAQAHKRCPTQATSLPATPSPSERVNLNTATLAELDALPGISSTVAQRIVAQRQRRSFGSLADLDEVPGIGPKTLQRLQDRVTWK